MEAASVPRRPLVGHPVATALVAVPVAAVAFAGYSALDERLIAAAMAAVLVVVATIDLERRIIPNRIVVPGTGLLVLARVASAPHRWREFLLATLLVAAVFAVPSLINASLVGMGDAKLAAFLGAGLGWGAVGAVCVAFIAVFPFALATFARSGLAARKYTLPFGPFLAFGGLVILIVPRLFGVAGG